MFAKIPEFQKLLTKLGSVTEDSPINDIEAVTKQFIAFFSAPKGVEKIAQTIYNEAQKT